MLPRIHLVRHGETLWSITGQHTSTSDIALTDRGESEARRLGDFLRGMKFARVMTSPLQRAKRTCELAGFGDVAAPDSSLIEWKYGDYEGLRTAEIRTQRPDWNLWQHGSPGGESPD